MVPPLEKLTAFNYNPKKHLTLVLPSATILTEIELDQSKLYYDIEKVPSV